MGDRLFFLTDGFTDAMNARQEMLGLEQLERLICRPEAVALDAESTLSFLAGEVRRFAGDVPQHDDMTMVVSIAL